MRLALAEAQKVSAEKNMRRRANRVREASRRGYGSPPVANRGSTVRVPADERETLLPKHGGYENTITWQLADLIYDVTVRFCDKYINPKSRTHDQMVQAARSGVQNIAEGSQAAGTSRKMELKLTNVARASLEELRLDYEDYLRQRNLAAWAPGDARRAELIAKRPATADDVAAWVQELHDEGPGGQDRHRGPSIPSTPSTAWTYPALAANAALTLIAVACSLLDRQLAAQAAAFEKDGGFTERLYRARSAKRSSRD